MLESEVVGFDGKKTEIVSFRASPAMVRALDALAQEDDRSRAYFARRFVETGLELEESNEDDE